MCLFGLMAGRRLQPLLRRISGEHRFIAQINPVNTEQLIEQCPRGRECRQFAKPTARRVCMIITIASARIVAGSRGSIRRSDLFGRMQRKQTRTVGKVVPSEVAARTCLNERDHQCALRSARPLAAYEVLRVLACRRLRPSVAGSSTGRSQDCSEHVT